MQIPDTFDPDRRYVFNNWSDEDFVGQWNGVQTLIKAGEIKELSMYLAYHFTKHFVDREMSKKNQDAFLAVEETRKPYEDKTISEITSGVDSPSLAALKEKIREEVAKEENPTVEVKKAVKKVKVAEEKAEFAGIE